MPKGTMRKTFPLARLIDAANARMISKPEDRAAIFWFTSDILLEGGAYKGFAYGHVYPLTDRIVKCLPPEGHGGLSDPAYLVWVQHAGEEGHLRLLFGGERLRYAEALNLSEAEKWPMRPLADPVEAVVTAPSERLGYDAPAGAGHGVEAERG